VNADKTLTRTVTLTLNLTLFYALYGSHLTDGSLLKRLIREAAGFNLNSRCFVDGRVSVKRVI